MARRTSMAVGALSAVTAVAAVAMIASALAKPQPGDLDHSFSGNGVARTQFDGNSTVANSMAIGRKGRIVAFGTHSVRLSSHACCAPSRFALVRYKPNGRLDRSFSGNGKVSTGFGKSDAYGQAVAIGPKGSTVVAGQICREYPGPCLFGVAKYRSDGHLDSSFGNGGKKEIKFGGTSEDSANAVAIDSRGRVLVAGTSCAARFSCDFTLARLDPHGNLDPSFGDGGRVVAQLEDKGGEPVSAHASSIAIAKGGRILLAGGAGEEAPLGSRARRAVDLTRVALARYLPNGDLDPGFGTLGRGMVVRRVGNGVLRAIRSIAIDAKEKIVAVGPADDQVTFGMARFRSSGALDKRFGRKGTVSTAFPHTGALATSVAIDSRNRIVVGGGRKFNLARYQPNGKLNRSFGHKGKVAKDLGFGEGSSPGSLSQRGINSVAIDSRDRPVAAGFSKSKLAVARLIG